MNRLWLILLCFPFLSFGQSAAISSITQGQTVSGNIPLTVALTNLPSVDSVEIILDGESQRILWSAPWSISSFNTNNRYNGSNHVIYAIVRNAMGNTIATTPTLLFSIQNSYLEPSSYINQVSCAPSNSTNTWSASVSLVCTYGGTNASNFKSGKVYVDGDVFGSTSLSGSTSANTTSYTINTTRYLNNAGIPHLVAYVVKDCGADGSCNSGAGLAPTVGGFPFAEWTASVVFNNTSTVLLNNTTSNGDSICWNGGACNVVSSLNAPAAGTVNITTGDFLLACFAYFQGGATTISDTLGNTWVGPINGGTKQSNWNQYCFYAVNAIGGADTFTATVAGGNAKGPSLLVREYTNVATSNPIDYSNVFESVSGTCPCVVSSGTFSTTNPNDVVITFYSPNINGTQYNPGLNSVLDSPSRNENAGGTSQYLSSVLTNGVATIGTSNASGQTYGMTVIALKAASSTPVATPSQVTLSPEDWVIPLTGSITLTPQVINADGTTTTVTTAMNPSYSTTALNSVCSLSMSGANVIVTGGGTFGMCPVTVTLGNGLTATPALPGRVSSTNAIPYVATDMQLHTAGGTPLFLASQFNSTPNTGFADLNKTLAQIAAAYTLGGRNTMENGLVGQPVNGSWGSSQTEFQQDEQTYINAQNAIMSAYGFYFHPSSTAQVVGGTGSLTNLWIGVYRDPTGTPDWQFAAHQWFLTGRCFGISFADETDAAFSCPFTNQLMGGGNLTQISCGAGSSPLCTIATANICHVSGSFAIKGGQSTCGQALNSVAGAVGSSTGMYNSNFGSPVTFTGPSAAAGCNVTPATDPALSIQFYAEQWATGGTYSLNTDFITISQQIQAGGMVVAGAPRAVAGPTIRCGWDGPASTACPQAGNPGFSGYAEIYNSPAANGTAQNVAVPAILTDPNNVFVQNTSFINSLGAERGFMGQVQNIQLNYGMNGQAIIGIVANGSTLTFPQPHGILNIVPYVSRITLSGSANSYYNDNFYIDNCPTEFTCNISRALPSVAGVLQSSGGTLTFSNGVTMGPGAPYVCITTPASGSSNYAILGSTTQGSGLCSETSPPPANVIGSMGSTFTYANATGGSASYWESNTFILSQRIYPSNSYVIREVPSPTQSTSSVNGVLVANNTYNRGQDQNIYGELLQGERIPDAMVEAQALTGAFGIRDYTLGGDNNVLFSAAGANNQSFGTGVGSVTITGNGGSGCISAKVSFSGGGGSAGGAFGQGVISGGVITSVNMIDAGSFYTSVPTVNWSYTGCSTAPTGTANLTTLTVGLPCTKGSGCIQGGVSMFYDNGADMVRVFNSEANIDFVLESLASRGYLYGSRGNAPNIANRIESSLRLNPKGNLLIVGNFQDSPQSVQVPLNGCDVPGQEKIRYTVSWSGVSINTLVSGTLSDTATIPAAGSLFYLCSNNAAAEYQPPTLAVHGPITDEVPNAASWIAVYSYSPYMFQWTTSNRVNCGSSPTCTVPVDPQLGPVSWYPIYLDVNNVELANPGPAGAITVQN